MRPRTQTERHSLRMTARRQGKTQAAIGLIADDYAAIRDRQLALGAEQQPHAIKPVLLGDSIVIADSYPGWWGHSINDLHVEPLPKPASRWLPEMIVDSFDLSTFEGYTAWLNDNEAKLKAKAAEKLKADNPIVSYEMATHYPVAADNTVGDIPLNEHTAPKLAALTEGMRKAFSPVTVAALTESWRDNATAEHLVFTLPQKAPSSRGTVIAGAVRSAISRVIHDCPGCAGVDVLLDESSFDEFTLHLRSQRRLTCAEVNGDGKGTTYMGARILQYDTTEEMLEARPTWPKRKTP